MMAQYDVDDSFLQNILDSLFSFLSSVLPGPIYTIAESLITHSVALLVALVNFGFTLVNGQSWDAQKILPPLITLLAAYLALVSFYRTTGWMIRTAFWFVKWGGILSALAAGAGYFMGNANANGENGGVGAVFNGAGGLLGMLGSALLGMLNDGGQTPRDSRSTRNGKARAGAGAPRTRAQTRKQKEKQRTRPKAWENWDKHNEWQYDANTAARDNAARANDGVQETVQKVMGIVRDTVGTSWWETVKNAVEGSGLVGSNDEHKEDQRSQRRPKRDSKAQSNVR
ncbi:hypothetical protein C2E23DRAFT_830864 [Lenzites betulinus]|nr:hypothetical protein C2E23DRAFT_830864 [Lenzites betulinus]